MKSSDTMNDYDHDIVGSCPHDVFYVSPTPPDLEGLYIQINRAGIVLECPRDFYISRDDTYRYCVLHCMIRGKGTVTVRGHSYRVERRQMFLLCANEEHSYHSDPDDPMGVVWVEFCGGGSARIVKHIMNMGGCVYGAPIFSDVMNACTALLYQQSQQGPHISRMIYDMLMTFCAYADENQLLGVSSSRILNYIDENLDHPLTLKEVATVFGYHPAYFSSLFSRMMGVSFSKYVMKRKLNHACYLLEATNWPVERVARELGFWDVSHFIKRFRAVLDVSPTAYRTSYRRYPTARKRFL